MKHQSIENSCPIIEYKNGYYNTSHNCGGSGYSIVNTYITQIKEEKNQLQITVKVIFCELIGGDMNEFYYDLYTIDKKTEIGKNIGQNSIGEHYFKEADAYKYTFTKNKENYSFISVEKVK